MTGEHPDDDDEERRAQVGAELVLEAFDYIKAIAKGLAGAGGG